MTTLDRYAAAFTGAYPGVELNHAGKAAHEQLRVRLAQLTPSAPAPGPTPTPGPAPTPVRPWKGLAIGGGVSIGVGVGMLGMWIGSYVVRRQAEEDIRLGGGCAPELCAELFPELTEKGTRAGKLATFGAIAAPIFVVAGAAMLGVALKRRKSSTHALAPVLSPTMAGLTWQHRF